MKLNLGYLLLAGLIVCSTNSCTTLNTSSHTSKRFIFLCFGQSNMEGFPGIEAQRQGPGR